MINGLPINAITIILLASAMVQGKKCYPMYSSSTSYKEGDWVSYTHFDVIMDSMGERTKQAHSYNYRCKSEASVKLCSSAALAPGQPDGVWGIAWEQDNEECYTKEVAPHIGLRRCDAGEDAPSPLRRIEGTFEEGTDKMFSRETGDHHKSLRHKQSSEKGSLRTMLEGKSDIDNLVRRRLQLPESCNCNTRFIKLESTTGQQIQVFEVRAFSSSFNVAKGGNATQSSTYKNLEKFNASMAIDDNVITFSHTSDDRAWWQVDLGEVNRIDSVQILNRWCTDPSDSKNCLCRLSDANLSLLDGHGLVIATHSLGNTCDLAELVLTFCIPPSEDCFPRASLLKLTSITGAPIQVFEVEVYSSGINVAQNKLAMQSSTLNTYVAAKAVDGNNSTFSHTEGGASSWEVDLGGEFSIESVKILNRWCRNQSDPTDCLCRLSHAVLSLFNDNGEWVDSILLGNTCVQLDVSVDTGKCVNKSTNITLSMTLHDWAQFPFSGNISEEEEGLKLQGSAHRVGNAVISKQWFDLQKSTVYFKWKASGVSYAGWSPSIKDVKGGGYLTTGWSYGGSSIIPQNEYIYTKISCDVDAIPPKCDAWASTGNYIDQLAPSPTELRYETSQLTGIQVDKLKTAQLHWGVVDNYGGVEEYGFLAEVKIVNGRMVEIPVTSQPLYQGESYIPDSFSWSSGYGTCFWEVIGLCQCERVIKGSWLNGHSSDCKLKLNITDPNARGVSFSMKTEVDSPQGEYASLVGLGIGSNSASDWKSYTVPVETPSVQQWELRPSLDYFTGNEFIYVKDIKLLVKQETTTTTTLAPTTEGATTTAATGSTAMTTVTTSNGPTEMTEGTTTTTEGTTTMTEGTTTTAATANIIIPMTLNYWMQDYYTGKITEEEEGLKLHGSGDRIGNSVISKQWFDLQNATIYFKWKAWGVSYAGWNIGVSGIIGGGYLTTDHSFGGSIVIPSNEYIYTKISCDVDVNPPKCDAWTSTGNYIDQLAPTPTQLWHGISELSDIQLDTVKRTKVGFGFLDNYGGVADYGILVEVKIKNGTEVESPTLFESVYQGESNNPDSFTVSSGDSEGK